MKKPKCPKCGSSKAIEIIYGMPPSDLAEQEEQGKIKLGGCCIDEKNPNWHCKDCEHEWEDYMANITKKELIDRIAQIHQVQSATTRRVIQAFLDEVINELANGHRLEFRDFGVFETKTRAAREAQNPKTLEKVHVPAKRSVKFKMGRLMKQKLNTPE